MDVKAADAEIISTADVGNKVVTNHNGLNLLKLVLFEENIEETNVRLGYQMVGADEDSVEIIVKAHHLKLRHCGTASD